LSIFGRLWIDVYDMFQFPPISSNFTQPLKREMGQYSTGHNQQPDQLDVKELRGGV
jgi:hypothetical protein